MIEDVNSVQLSGRSRWKTARTRPLHSGTADFPRDCSIPALVARVRVLEQAHGGLPVPSPELAFLHSVLAQISWKCGALQDQPQKQLKEDSPQACQEVVPAA